MSILWLNEIKQDLNMCNQWKKKEPKWGGSSNRILTLNRCYSWSFFSLQKLLRLKFVFSLTRKHFNLTLLSSQETSVHCINPHYSKRNLKEDCPERGHSPNSSKIWEKMGTLREEQKTWTLKWVDSLLAFIKKNFLKTHKTLINQIWDNLLTVAEKIGQNYWCSWKSIFLGKT